jgi:hypothetical protein
MNLNTITLPAKARPTNRKPEEDCIRGTSSCVLTPKLENEVVCSHGHRRLIKTFLLQI